MKCAILAVICCFLLIGAMAMPKGRFSWRERRTERLRSLDEDDRSEKGSETHRGSEFHRNSDSDYDRSETHRGSEIHRNSDDDDSSERRFEGSSSRSLSDQYECGYAVNPIYRWYNSNKGDHLYCCGSEGSSSGYTYQEIGFQTLKYRQTNSVMLYRLYKAAGGYFYTSNYQEVEKAVAKFGWVLQGNIGYVFTFQVTGSFALHRYYNSEINRHFYTIHPEHENLSGRWTHEGVIGYAFDSN